MFSFDGSVGVAYTEIYNYKELILHLVKRFTRLWTQES